MKECDFDVQLVCSPEADKVYLNPCIASCDNSSNASAEFCPETCASLCPAGLVFPVCTADGKEYQNPCFAFCNEDYSLSFQRCNDSSTDNETRQVVSLATLSFPALECSSAQNQNCNYSDYNPVCGSDNATYLNPCFALCQNISNYTLGSCNLPPVIDFCTGACPSDFNSTVCGKVIDDEEDEESEDDLQSYQNLCFAACDGVEQVVFGSCDDIDDDDEIEEHWIDIDNHTDEQIRCAMLTCNLNESNWVCGDNNRSYYNPCLAECHGENNYAVGGACGSPLINFCPKDLNATVCSLEGDSYQNPCFAFCDSDTPVFSLYSGPCDTEPSGDLVEYANLTQEQLWCALRNCSFEDETVCGSDQKNYLNPCIAACAGISNVTAGRCLTCDDICPGSQEFYLPVCGENQTNYENPCFALCHGHSKVSFGECVDCVVNQTLIHLHHGNNGNSVFSCAAEQCDFEMEVVCGFDGNTYLNPCIAECNGIDDYTSGVCHPMPTCDQLCNKDEEQPVCTEVGVLYINPCFAMCEGKYNFSLGACVDEELETPIEFYPLTYKAWKCIADRKCNYSTDFVCDAEKRQFLNPCIAECSEVFESTPGLCFPVTCESKCPERNLTVCTPDSQEFGNPCLAFCAEEYQFFLGNCSSSPSEDDDLCSFHNFSFPAVHCSVKQCGFDKESVCGFDNVTYWNPCIAECNQVFDYEEGECNGPPSCNDECSDVNQTVCSLNQTQYLNPCTAVCSGQTQFRLGECLDNSSAPIIDLSNFTLSAVRCVQSNCTFQEDQVCGSDNRTYFNPCFAECTGLDVYRTGPCEPVLNCESLCPVSDMPVCTEDGQQFGSPCLAVCNQQFKFRAEACDDDEDEDDENDFVDFTGLPLSAVICAQSNCELDDDDDEISPVCGADNITYWNGCVAECNNVTFVDNACNATCADLCPDSDDDDDEVCAENGEDYSSPCQAYCAGQTRFQVGECDDDDLSEEFVDLSNFSFDSIVCTQENCDLDDLEFVCGSDNRTYWSSCVATCNNITVFAEGACSFSCSDQCADAVNLTVCSENGTQYANPCLAVCNQDLKFQVGVCGSNTTVISDFTGLNSTVISCAIQTCNLTAFDLVCGSDNITYWNPCVASCNQISSYQEDACQLSELTCFDLCPSSNLTVCGTNDPEDEEDRTEYKNPCVALCSGAQQLAFSNCSNLVAPFVPFGYNSSTLQCLATCDPTVGLVCGSDGQTYFNLCHAQCQGATVVSAGVCGGICQQFCPSFNFPVCGADGVQYENPCFAACVGQSFTTGPCAGSAPSLFAVGSDSPSGSSSSSSALSTGAVAGIVGAAVFAVIGIALLAMIIVRRRAEHHDLQWDNSDLAATA